MLPSSPEPSPQNDPQGLPAEARAEAPGDEVNLGVPSRDGLVSLSQAAEVLGFRGQELWNMLRGAGITIHRVDWEDCRGSAISLRDLFRLRQAQVPPQHAGRNAPPPPVQREALPEAGPEAGSMAGAGAGAWGAGRSAVADEAALSGLEASALGADMERLRDLVRDAQLRNEYLSVELQGLRRQMAERGVGAGGRSDPALEAVRAGTAQTVADLRNQVKASTTALEEAAEALEAERSRNRELEARVKDLRSDLLKLSRTGDINELREALSEEREKSSRIQHDLERSLSLQRRSIARLEREKQALAERLAVRDEVERNNQRYIDRLERQIEQIRRKRSDGSANDSELDG